MALCSREEIVTIIRDQPVSRGSVSLTPFLDELHIAQPMAVNLGVEGSTHCLPVSAFGYQNAVGALRLAQAPAYLLELFHQQINEAVAVHQLREAEEGLLLFEAVLLITKHVHGGPPAQSLG
ncbi:hypothetical protein PPL19_01785 [Pseudomonas psychrotolerans L19]|nr:hypothetical protein PPL19_01785 [Pseudomonas psychrotolerans L19]